MGNSKFDRQIAVYAGTFDPITNGHLDILERALGVFPKVYLAVASGGPRSAAKATYFSTEERLKLASDSVSSILPSELVSRVQVVSFEGMLVEFAKMVNAKVIVRGATCCF